METLVKITYNNIEQFTIDINRNFAVLQNSPLYKGIPGRTMIGDIGPIGLRGSQFLFISFLKFNEQFPTQITIASQINLNFINSKLSDFVDKQKLLLALEVNELVKNDIIVLTNSMMISYNDLSNLFIDTKIAFNNQINLLSSIENKVQELVTAQLAQNPIINTTNTFTTYSSYLTNLPLNSNLPIINTPTSIYEPYLNGTINGNLLNDHKYWGFTEVEFPETINGTIVFGSIRQYFNLLEGTIDPNTNYLTSNYAPGTNNIPTAVFLQDTANNCILFGLKNNPNLKAFGSIYKDADSNVVIKSDSGNLIDDFSELLINKVRLKYSKSVEFGDELLIDGNLLIGGNISHQYIRTNQFTTANTIEIGSTIIGSIQRNISYNIQLPKFISNVLITDASGNISKSYSLETIHIPTINLDLSISDGFPSGVTTNKLLTSNYLNFIYNKFNSLSDKINLTETNFTNYYSKDDFTNGLVNDIINSGCLITYGDVNICYSGTNALISAIGGESMVSIGYNNQSTLNLNCKTYFNYIKNKILYTDNTGLVVSTYDFNDFSISDISLNNSISIGSQLPIDQKIFSASNNENIVSIGKDDNSEALVYGHLLPKLNTTKAVLVIDDLGRVATGVDEYSICEDAILDSSVPFSSTDTYVNIVPENYANSEKKILNGLQFNWIIKTINSIKFRLKNTYSKTESDNLFTTSSTLIAQIHCGGSGGDWSHDLTKSSSYVKNIIIDKFGEGIIGIKLYSSSLVIPENLIAIPSSGYYYNIVFEQNSTNFYKTHIEIRNDNYIRVNIKTANTDEWVSAYCIINIFKILI